MIVAHVEGRGLCIQAGGACGVWPWHLAQYFDQVMTFEPESRNFACLVCNTAELDNVEPFGLALSDRPGRAGITVDDFEATNCGAYYLTDGDRIECTTVDALQCAPDLIQLDIEGGELAALQGAVETLTQHKPVVVIEEKPLPHITTDYLAPRRYLESLGYCEVAAVHRDVIFAT